MELEHWRYYLALEAEFEETTRYVEVAEANFGTFSIAFAWLLLSLGSEVDVVAKQLCAALAPKERTANIDDYRHVLGGHIWRQVVTLPRFNVRRMPWRSWEGEKNPEWWLAYNHVKHERHERFSEASLENTVDALAGLYVLLMHLYVRDLPMLSEEPSRLLRLF